MKGKIRVDPDAVVARGGTFDLTRAWGTSRFTPLSLGAEDDPLGNLYGLSDKQLEEAKVIEGEDRSILAQEDSSPWGQESPWEEDAEH